MLELLIVAALCAWIVKREIELFRWKQYARRLARARKVERLAVLVIAGALFWKWKNGKAR